MTKENYVFTNQWTMEREGAVGLWHLRNADGDLVDLDKYRHDIIERHHLEILKYHDPMA